MDAQLVNIIIEATLYIIDTLASTQVSKAHKPYSKKGQKPSGDICGFIEMKGNPNGTIAVCFNKSGILSIVSTMLFEEIKEINDEIIDAVGEISNQISGHVKTKMGDIGKTQQVRFVKSISATDLILHFPNRPTLVLPFETKDGRFTIEICFDK
ncbi:MAG: chemotaxis protein CheX [Desulfobacterales bacterium]|nr:chemotaxis protein CheX [Desulfobacterales bacterium]